MSHKNKNYKEGYVPSTERLVTPTEFDPNTSTPVDPIERPVVVRTSGLVIFQDLDTRATIDDGDLITDDSFDTDPASGSNMCLFVNGQAYFPADGEDEVATSPFYVTNSTGTVVRTQGTFVAGDQFHWNQSVAGYNIEADDVLKISYEVS